MEFHGINGNLKTHGKGQKHRNRKQELVSPGAIMKIYTKKGDTGETSDGLGRRVKKCDPAMDCLGTLDELNCNIGHLICAYMDPDSNAPFLGFLQNVLFDVGSAISCPGKFTVSTYLVDVTLGLEQEIDRIDKTIPPLRNFILPGGGSNKSSVASYLHVIRSVCRRAERECVNWCCQDDSQLANDSDRVEILKFLNRLSDYLFTLARSYSGTDTPYTKYKPVRF